MFRLDEPINHLDLEAVEWLEEFLLAYKGILTFGLETSSRSGGYPRVPIGSRKHILSE
ncbi:hypothetical protein DSUL_50171 [Desulfovibrionales bacterium]